MQKHNKKCKKLTKNAKKTINQQKASEIFRLLIFRRLLFLITMAWKSNAGGFVLGT